jgi:hypothetical protein
MNHRITAWILAGIATAWFLSTARGDDPKSTQAAIQRGLTFLQEDVAKWRKEKECATCHHGTLTVWALSEAKSQGYEVQPEVFADILSWTKARLANIDKPRDTRPGLSMVNSPALNLAFMAQAIPKQDALSADELKQITGHLLRHQEADGSWAWSSAPAVNRPPPFFESDEVATILGRTALRAQLPADTNERSDVRESYDKAAAWLAKTEPTKTTQSLAYLLFQDVAAGRNAEELQPQIDALLARQNADGGWGQLKDAPSDAYGTGQALYFLTIAGVPKDRPEIKRGVQFLVTSQKEDGSWPMVRRGHPGVTPGPFVMPIIYFGSAWGTMGLMRTNAAQ